MNLFFQLSFMLIMISLNSLGQNLVFNPSFENHKRRVQYCITTNKLKKVSDWKQVTYGTVDYFKNDSKCQRNKSNLKAKSGEHFIGIYGLLTGRKKKYREYFQGNFKTPLKKGVSYNVEFYVRTASNSTVRMSGFGAYIHNEPINANNSKRLKYVPQVSCKEIINDEIWLKVNQVYVAQGGEKYITLGVFEPYRKLKKEKEFLFGGYCYFYIDDISVTEISSEFIRLKKDSTISFEQKTLSVLPKINDTLVLPNIRFKTNSYTIIDSTCRDLDKLGLYLKINPFVKITIYGHTDSIGNEKGNLKLSRNRANSAKKYLVNLGISENRIRIIGKGSQSPIASNKTIEGREMNRRLEIIIDETFELNDSLAPK